MPSNDRRRTFLHPASGVLILALDWLLFSGSALSLGLGTPALASVGFLLGLLSVAAVQRRYGQDATGISGLKGLLAGLAVGIPLPIAGTAVGALVLSLSGLNRWRDRLRLQGDTSDEDDIADETQPDDTARRGDTRRKGVR